MKKLLAVLTAALLLSGPACYAQDSAYKEQVKKIFSQTSSLDSLFRAGAIDFSTYDAWFKQLRLLSDSLVKNFGRSHDKFESYQLLQEGLTQLNEVWNALKQAQYADTEYKESITGGDVGYAHKWKASAMEQRKKALELIPSAIDYFKRAKDVLSLE